MNGRFASALMLIALLAGCASVPQAPPPAAPVAEAGVAFDAAGERGAYAIGFADPAAGRALTPDDPVRVASVSKLVVAIGVMKLVEQGRLDLHSDVSQKLGWSLRNPAFPDRPVSLRQLLSHTSSIRDHDDQYVIPLGRTVREVMAEPASWDPRRGPGDGYFTYANLNFPIVASLIERVTGERFDIWMRREVIEPLGLDACFNWPTCNDAAVARAVVLMQDGKVVRDDLKGRQPDCPVFVRDGEPCDLAQWRPGDNGSLFSPQGGLRISARGLARIGRMLLGRGTLDGVRILSPESVDAILAPAWTYDGTNGETDRGFYCAYGLAAQILANPAAGCADDPGRDGVRWSGHAGDAYGVRSGLWVDRARGVGIAYFVTGMTADPPRGRSAYRSVEETAFERTKALLKR